MSLSLNIWYSNTQDWALKATKAYDEASTVEYSPKPPNLMGKEPSCH